MKKIVVLIALLLSMSHFSAYAQTVTSSSVININSATASQLSTLKGVGDKKAQAIVDYRTAHGAFKSVNDLSQVKGFGSKRLARIQSQNPGKLTS